MDEPFDFAADAGAVCGLLEIGDCPATLIGGARDMAPDAPGLRLLDFGAAAGLRRIWPAGAPGRSVERRADLYVEDRRLGALADRLRCVFAHARPLRMAVLGAARGMIADLGLAAARPDVVASASGVGRGWVRVDDLGMNPGFVIEAACSRRASAAQTLLIRAASLRSRRQAEAGRPVGLDGLILLDGFHPAERDGPQAWSWTGEGSPARFLVPSPGGEGLWTLRIGLRQSHIVLAPGSVKVSVDGSARTVRLKPESLEIEIEGCDASPPWICVEMVCGSGPERPRGRWIGVALERAQVLRS